MRILFVLAVLLSCASCSHSRHLAIDWQIPSRTVEQRQAWEEATGRDLQYRDGISSMFW